VANLPTTRQQRVDDATGSTADRQDLATALNVLTPKQRAIVALRYLEDRAVTEVAEVLGISCGTVKRQSHDAMAVLRRHLSASHEDDCPHQAASLKRGGTP
jgi:RNA polymerase sigma factor (sigma-70 family)